MYFSGIEGWTITVPWSRRLREMLWCWVSWGACVCVSNGRWSTEKCVLSVQVNTFRLLRCARKHRLRKRHPLHPQRHIDSLRSLPLSSDMRALTLYPASTSVSLVPSIRTPHFYDGISDHHRPRYRNSLLPIVPATRFEFHHQKSPPSPLMLLYKER